METKPSLFNHPDVSYTFDFRKKRVKLTTTTPLDTTIETMAKFSIGYTVSSNGDYYKGLLIKQDAYNYEEAKEALLNFLEKQQFNNVTIIK